jgi:two-component system, NtrC family, response regulator PilR
VSGHLLVVDDESHLRELLRIVLEGERYTVSEAGTYADAMQKLARGDFDLVICDIVLPDGNGLDLLRAHHATHPATPFVMITAHSTPVHMLASLRDGAVEYLSKPFDVDELKLIVGKHLAGPPPGPSPSELAKFIGRSRSIQSILQRITQIARSDATVLITGESGTGKELLARAIHDASPRSSHPFVPVNCGALPEGLLESELFGHVRGSFTGAVRDKRGLFEEATNGTIFLDEIGDLPLALQVKLLRTLQDKRIRAVGGNREQTVDARVVAATNTDLRALIEQGRFREDLFFRINVLQLHVPPLRDRREDIPALAQQLVERACTRLGMPRKQLHRDTISVLENSQWPGNVRELENIIEQAVAMEPSSLISVGSLSTHLLMGSERAPNEPAGLTLPDEGLDIEAHLDAARRELMSQALRRTGGVQKNAARLLRMTYRAFRYHAEKCHLISTED